MSSYIDAIPQAVATIVSSCVAQSGQYIRAESKDFLEKWVVDLTDNLTRTFAKALREAEAAADADSPLSRAQSDP